MITKEEAKRFYKENRKLIAQLIFAGIIMGVTGVCGYKLGCAKTDAEYVETIAKQNSIINSESTRDAVALYNSLNAIMHKVYDTGERYITTYHKNVDADAKVRMIIEKVQ